MQQNPPIATPNQTPERSQQPEQATQQVESITNIMNIISQNIKQDFNQLLQDVGSIANMKNNIQQANIKENQHQNQDQNKKDEIRVNNQLDQQKSQMKQQQFVKSDIDDDKSVKREGQEQMESAEILAIRTKEKQLMEELEKLREKQRQLKGRQNINYREPIQNQEENQNKDQVEEQVEEQEEQNFFYFLEKPNLNQEISPTKRVRYPRKPKQKPTIPDPVVPQMSRQQFEQKVKRIAVGIRSKVHKLSPLPKQTIKNTSEIKKIKVKGSDERKQKFSLLIQLPEIKTDRNNNKKIKMSVTQNSMVSATISPRREIVDDQEGMNEKYKKDEQFGDAQEIEEQQKDRGNQGENKRQSLERNTNSKVIKWIVEQIVKKAFEKIRYKQKYGIKLDPVHHKYPMTSFRKKILAQKQQKQKQRYYSESVRQSVLTQRKSIFQKSRYK